MKYHLTIATNTATTAYTFEDKASALEKYHSELSYAYNQHHTSGGNSGSPVINGDGELIGINFDRTWNSTMSDLEFDPSICRNISVDIRYVLFLIDKVGGAGYLLNEMDLM